MKRHLLFLALAPIFAGCATDYLRADADAGLAPADASILVDAPIVADAAPDADTGPAGACTDGVRWIDETPLVRWSTTTPALAAGSDGFVLVSSFFDGDAWQYWIEVDAISAGGAHTSTEGARFFGDRAGMDDPPPQLFATADPTGHVHVAAMSTRLWWSDGPDWDVAAGSLALSRPLGAIAFEGHGDGAIVIESHDTVLGPDGTPHAAAGTGRVERVWAGDELGPERLAIDPGFSFEYWRPALVAARDGVWLAIVDDWDFPPTVQLAGPPGALVDASSCGVESFDFVAASASTAVVAQDCGAIVRIAQRSFDAARRQIEIPGRDARAPQASRLATDGRRFVLAHRGDDGAAHVTILDASLTPLATARVPGSEATADRVPGVLGVAAMPDGTYAVLTTLDVPSAGPRWQGGGEARVQRFRACE